MLLPPTRSVPQYQTYILGRPAATVVADVVLRATAGWAVDFGAFSDVDGVAGGLRRVAVPPSRLVVGLANGPWSAASHPSVAGVGSIHSSVSCAVLVGVRVGG